MRRLATILFPLLLVACGADTARIELATNSPDGVEAFLREFHENPAREMDRLPDLVRPDGQLLPRGYIDREAVAARLPFRLKTRAQVEVASAELPPGFSTAEPVPGGRDSAERLVEGGVLLQSLSELEALGLTRSTLAVLPWADSYWPIYKGLVANRYADPRSPRSKDWINNYLYSQYNPASAVIASGDASAIDLLSPAEKYDYAVGDLDFTLTRYSWVQGEKYHEESGQVASWMGICHGWAAAAHMNAPIPERPVRVIAASGLPLTFYPQDIKALQSMLWANASPKTRFVGNRCYVSKPERNRNGRILDPNCFDSNPATWHTAITNQLGIHGRSFIMDSTFDAEVWNFPVASYRYRYFNPETWKEGVSYRASMIPISNFRIDKFREFRSPRARYIVGVYMDVAHVGAINPTRGKLTKPPLTTLRFVYDLELDESLQVIGGEWYSNAHPDFLWTFDPAAQATTTADGTIGQDPWRPGLGAVPSHWATAAQRASLRGSPLSTFVRWLAAANSGEGEEPPVDTE